MAQMRMTSQTDLVLGTLLGSERALYGREIAYSAELVGPTVYKILRRLEERGFTSGAWEGVDQSTASGPRRRLYRLTAEGRALARRRGLEPLPLRRPTPAGRHRTRSRAMRLGELRQSLGLTGGDVASALGMVPDELDRFEQDLTRALTAYTKALGGRPELHVVVGTRWIRVDFTAERDPVADPTPEPPAP